MVQIAEELDETSAASKAGYSNLAVLSRDRIRRAEKSVTDGKPDLFHQGPSGFRVLKIDSSNMKDVYYSPADTSQSMLSGLVDNIKPDRTAEDLLFQVLLDCGVDLGLPIKSEKIDDCEVFFVNDSEHAAPDLVACFDPDVPESLVKTIAAKSPLRAVFRDQCFATDADKINVEQIFKQLSPSTQLKSL
ncbi:MAG TPA: type III restriction endonuclease subunit M [Planctomycetaceae bacterium]|nr:type III restriction endonuclease subunit M [Planctomycetaceae bacterium]